MKKNRKAITVAAACILVVSFAMMIYASGEASFLNSISTGGVDIKVTGKAENTLLAAGKEIEYSQTITNQGVPSYIRFKLDTDNEELVTDSFYGLDKNWIQRGNYFYCTKPVEHNESIRTFTGFKVPCGWENGSADVNVVNCVEAIQKENFEPDFKSDYPWGDVKVVKSDFDGRNYVQEVQTTEPIKLTFRTSKDFDISFDEEIKFSGVPGDRMHNQIVLKNESENKMKIYFKVDAEKNKLFEAITLNLYKDEQVIYKGKLFADELQNYKDIMILNPGSGEELKYEVILPKTLDNAYADQLEQFKLTFKSEEIDENGNPVKTSDENNLFAWFVPMAAALVIMYILKKVKHEEEDI